MGNSPNCFSTILGLRVGPYSLFFLGGGGGLGPLISPFKLRRVPFFFLGEPISTWTANEESLAKMISGSGECGGDLN